ncbi:MAG: hypothetical protein ABIS27_00070, partial [Longimicrobiales bacterium]
FIELLGIGLLVGATYFLSTMFDKTTYSFDKTADGFVIEGRKSVFNRWSIFGTVSGVSEIVCHVTGDLETFNSEVYLTYAAHGAALQTRKCGTGEIDEDQAIANTIRQFLSRTA